MKEKAASLQEKIALQRTIDEQSKEITQLKLQLENQQFQHNQLLKQRDEHLTTANTASRADNSMIGQLNEKISTLEGTIQKMKS